MGPVQHLDTIIYLSPVGITVTRPLTSLRPDGQKCSQEGGLCLAGSHLQAAHEMSPAGRDRLSLSPARLGAAARLEMRAIDRGSFVTHLVRHRDERDASAAPSDVGIDSRSVISDRRRAPRRHPLCGAHRRRICRARARSFGVRHARRGQRGGGAPASAIDWRHSRVTATPE